MEQSFLNPESVMVPIRCRCSVRIRPYTVALPSVQDGCSGKFWGPPVSGKYHKGIG